MKRKIIETVIVLVVASTVFLSCNGNEMTLDNQVIDEVDDNDIEQEDFAEISDELLAYVYVCGAVNNPGVYTLKPGARVYEAIELAGGMSEDACDEGMNLVEPIEDGMKIRVLSVFELDDDSESTLVNINTADVDKLCSIPGIGVTRAQAIVSYREQNGNFGNIEDLMNVSGIKEGTFEKIRQYITT